MHPSRLDIEFDEGRGRHLQEIIANTGSFVVTSALDCIYYCIFENNNFCPTVDGSSGLCCLDGKDCEKNEFCSYDAPIASTSLQYFSCPMKRESCGMDFIHVPEVDGTV